MKWYVDSSDSGEISFLIVEAKLHDLPRWDRGVLTRAGVLVSRAMQALLAFVRERLLVEPEDEAHRLRRATFTFPVSEAQADSIGRLLAQPLKTTKAGAAVRYTNGYCFTQCVQGAGGIWMASAELAFGEWREGKRRGAKPRFAVSIIPSTTAFQGLLHTYVGKPFLRILPTALRAGVCQEVAQQVTSYLGQLASARVKVLPEFPTVEDRDPESRGREYRVAIETLYTDVRPFTHAKAREVRPGRYAEDDPRGDRLIVADPRWTRVLRSPHPHPIPLHFVKGDAVQILEGTHRFSAGVAKSDRHRGVREENPRVRASRSPNVQKRGQTGLRQYYAALPLCDGEDPGLGALLNAPRPKHGRGLDLALTPVPLMGEGAKRRKKETLLVPLSGDRGRFVRILHNPSLTIAWSRIVERKGEWFLQLTVRTRTPALAGLDRWLGITFGLDAVASWVLLDGEGRELDRDALTPNEHIARFLDEKKSLEWDQQRERWIGGTQYTRSLETIAHGVANQLIELAVGHRARLAIEEIAYVQKRGRDHERNVLFTAWNYGRLRRFLGYKAVLSGLPDVVTCGDYVAAFTCPNCGAMRRKGEDAESATTWREGNVLHCRKCDFAGELTPHDRARRVALHGIAWQEQRKEK